MEDHLGVLSARHRLSANHDISLFFSLLNLFCCCWFKAIQVAFTGKKEVSQRRLGTEHHLFLSLFLLIIFFSPFRIWEAWISISSICLDDALHLFFPAPRGRREPSFCLFIGLGDIGGRLPQSVCFESVLFFYFFSFLFSIFFYSLLTLPFWCVCVLIPFYFIVCLFIPPHAIIPP